MLSAPVTVPHFVGQSLDIFILSKFLACFSDPIRFVTGLLDSEQDSRYKVSMYAKAKQIGLPDSFVELRHEATHGDLPSLIVFRRAVERSLDWLWKDYWRYLGIRSGNLDEDEIDAFKEGREKLKEKLRSVLRNYSKACVDIIMTKGRKDVAMPAEVTDKVCLELVRVCKNERLVIAELVKVLLEYEMLIPGSRTRVLVLYLSCMSANKYRLGHQMDEVFPSWDSLLKKLTLHQSYFLTMLTDEMLICLISPSMLDIAVDAYREAMTMWLEQIYTTRGWATTTKRGKLDDNVVMETCLQNPNHWTVRLAVAVINSSSHKIAKEVYEDRVRKAATELNSKSRVPLVRSISIENLDRLLPSQRKWLASEEGLEEKAKYLKRTKRLVEQSEHSDQVEEEERQAVRPMPDGRLQKQDKQSKDKGVASRKDPEQDSDEDPEVEGWSKWKGSIWTAKPIGMV